MYFVNPHALYMYFSMHCCMQKCFSFPLYSEQLNRSRWVRLRRFPRCSGRQRRSRRAKQSRRQPRTSRPEGRERCSRSVLQRMASTCDLFPLWVLETSQNTLWVYVYVTVNGWTPEAGKVTVWSLCCSSASPCSGSAVCIPQHCTASLLPHLVAPTGLNKLQMPEATLSHQLPKYLQSSSGDTKAGPLSLFVANLSIFPFLLKASLSLNVWWSRWHLRGSAPIHSALLVPSIPCAELAPALCAVRDCAHLRMGHHLVFIHQEATRLMLWTNKLHMFFGGLFFKQSFCLLGSMAHTYSFVLHFIVTNMLCYLKRHSEIYYQAFKNTAYLIHFYLSQL